MMSGYRSYTAIAEYGQTYGKLREALGFRHPKTPCAATLYYNTIAKTMRYFAANPKQALTLLKNNF